MSTNDEAQRNWMAVGTLAEMEMTKRSRVDAYDRFAAYYDDETSTWVVVHQWAADRDDMLDEEELAREPQFPDAIDRAYEVFLSRRPS